MKLIVGLGNPGEKYIGTRHNLGFEVLENLSKEFGVSKWEEDKKFKCELRRQTLENGDQLILIKPQTFMNNSGMSVRLVADYFKISPEDIIVIHDDLDLLLGKIKVRIGGAAGGHHGVESIISSLGTDQFIRVRLGIGNDKSHAGEHKRVSFQAEHFVLEQFLPAEHGEVKKTVKKAVNALTLILEKDLETAQNQYN